MRPELLGTNWECWESWKYPRPRSPKPTSRERGPDPENQRASGSRRRTHEDAQKRQILLNTGPKGRRRRMPAPHCTVGFAPGRMLAREVEATYACPTLHCQVRRSAPAASSRPLIPENDFVASAPVLSPFYSRPGTTPSSSGYLHGCHCNQGASGARRRTH